VSECFCIELAVWDVAREVVEGREGVELEEVKDEVEDFKLATRLAVAGGIADTWIGGKLTSLAFLGSADDNVCKMWLEFASRRLEYSSTFPRFLPMRTEILLSLRSLSSFFDLDLSSFFSSFCFAFRSSRSESLPVSLLSAWKLFLELEPFNREGSPKLNTDDFRCAEGVENEVKLFSLTGEALALDCRRADV
jgi:hypothetical protein